MGGGPLYGLDQFKLHAVEIGQRHLDVKISSFKHWYAVQAIQWITRNMSLPVAPGCVYEVAVIALVLFA